MAGVGEDRIRAGSAPMQRIAFPVLTGLRRSRVGVVHPAGRLASRFIDD